MVAHETQKKSDLKRFRCAFKRVWRTLKRLPIPKLLQQRFNDSGRGRPPLYNWLRITAAIIATALLEDAIYKAASYIRDAKIDVSVNYQKRALKHYPSREEIYKIWERIPFEYLVYILGELDRWSYVRLFEKLKIFAYEAAVDGSAETLHRRELKLFAGKYKAMLVREDYTAVVRLLTNSVVLITMGTPRDISSFYEELYERHIHVLYGDAYFRVSENKERANELGISFVTKGERDRQARRPGVWYGKRKLCERVFGNRWMRGKRRLFGRAGSLDKKLIWLYIGHNLRAYERALALEALFEYIPVLGDAYNSL